jgi:hypothetical protein
MTAATVIERDVTRGDQGERVIRFPSGRWFGVKVERCWVEPDAFDVLVGTGWHASGEWNRYPVPFYGRAEAEAHARVTFHALADHAERQEDRRVAKGWT